MSRVVVFAALFAATAASASTHDYLPCAVGPSPPTPGLNLTSSVINPGQNYVEVLVCTAPNPTIASCATTNPAVVGPPCLLLSPNSSTYIRIDVAATAILLQYHSTQAFSWHPLASSTPVLVPWGSSSPPEVAIPYPPSAAGDNNTLLCDTDVDCPPSIACVPNPAPPRCASAFPSPSPAPSQQPAIPTPSPMPAAARCVINGSWDQAHPAAAASSNNLGHSADAFITFLQSSGSSSFTFACTSSKALCPGGKGLLNGTGTLSASGNAVTLTPSDGSGPISGFVNNTFSCTAITIASADPQVVWTSINPPPKPVLNLDVTAATFLGTGTTQLVATGIAILPASGSKRAPAAPTHRIRTGGGSSTHPSGTASAATTTTLVAVAGNGQAAYAGLTPVLLLGATASSNGTIVILSADVTAGNGSGVKAVQLVKVGDRVDHIRVNAKGDAAVAGSFGVAVITGLGGPVASVAVAWNDPLTDVITGGCGVCCTPPSGGNGANETCLVDIGDDGVVIADLAAAAAEGGDLYAVYSPTGKRLVQGLQPAASLTSVAVDSANSRFYVGHFYNSNTGKEPMVMPRVEAYAYSVETGTTGLDWTEFPWDATVYRNPACPCNGDVADGRVMGLRSGRDGTLLFMGRSDGGNSPFQCGIRNFTRTTPMAYIDGFTSAYNMQAQAITNFLRVDPVSGEVIVAQMQLTRVPSNTRGNTLITVAAQSDAATGTVYLLQNAACCIANMGNLTLNGQTLDPNIDATVLHVLTPNLETRLHWTHFVSNATRGGGAAVDIDVRDGAVALALTSSSAMVTVGALPNTGANFGQDPVAYVVIMPTVG
jgi:hypothetical protein